MAKRIPKYSKHRLIALSPVMIFVICYSFFTFGYYGYKLISLKNEQVKLSDNLQELQAEEKNLKNEIQKLKDPEYLARYARENFLYSKDGEYIIKIENKNKIVEEKSSLLKTIEENYALLIGTFSALIVLIIIFVFIKNKNKKSSLFNA